MIEFRKINATKYYYEFIKNINSFDFCYKLAKSDISRLIKNFQESFDKYIQDSNEERIIDLVFNTQGIVDPNEEYLTNPYSSENVTKYWDILYTIELYIELDVYLRGLSTHHLDGEHREFRVFGRPYDAIIASINGKYDVTIDFSETERNKLQIFKHYRHFFAHNKSEGEIPSDFPIREIYKYIYLLFEDNENMLKKTPTLQEGEVGDKLVLRINEINTFREDVTNFVKKIDRSIIQIHQGMANEYHIR